jgi:hypothetical protein
LLLFFRKEVSFFEEKETKRLLSLVLSAEPCAVDEGALPPSNRQDRV